MNTGIRGPRLSRLTGITERQRDYWARTGLLVPSVAAGMGSGYQRLYSDDDVLMALAIATLLRDGFTLNHIRWELAPTLRFVVEAGHAEYRWGAGPGKHSLDLASLRARLHGSVAA